MLAKLTAKNQLTLPKAVTERLGPVQYFEVQLKSGQILLTPVRIQRGDAVRAKLAELKLDDEAVAAALDWAVRPPARKAVAGKAAAVKAPVRKTATGKAKAVKAVKAATAVPAKATAVAKGRVGAKAVPKAAPQAAAARKTAARA